MTITPRLSPVVAVECAVTAWYSGWLTGARLSGRRWYLLSQNLSLSVPPLAGGSTEASNTSNHSSQGPLCGSMSHWGRDVLSDRRGVLHPPSLCLWSCWGASRHLAWEAVQCSVWSGQAGTGVWKIFGIFSRVPWCSLSEAEVVKLSHQHLTSTGLTPPPQLETHHDFYFEQTRGFESIVIFLVLVVANRLSVPRRCWRRLCPVGCQRLCHRTLLRCTRRLALSSPGADQHHRQHHFGPPLGFCSVLHRASRHQCRDDNFTGDVQEIHLSSKLKPSCGLWSIMHSFPTLTSSTIKAAPA
jgi:hypothetical protein